MFICDDDRVADQSITRDDEQMTRDDKTEVGAAKSSLRECYSAKNYSYWLEGL